MTVPSGDDADTVRVACLQIAPMIASPADNRVVVRAALADALDAGADVIVLPELVTTGYHLTPAEAVALAEDADGDSVDSWVAALGGSQAVVIGGFCERGSGGVVHNSAALVDAEGVVAVYRKTHLWDQEHRLFEPGTVPPPVVRTRWGSIGVAICYDLFFPELVRRLAIEGAALLAVPTNSPAGDTKSPGMPADSGGIGHLIARTSAYQSRVFIAVADRCGDERSHSWTSRSSIVGPEGEFLAGPVPYEPALLSADCTLTEAESKQWVGTTNDAFADRRPELYL